MYSSASNTCSSVPRANLWMPNMSFSNLTGSPSAYTPLQCDCAAVSSTGAAKRVAGEVKCLRDLFLRDVFYPLCGGLLPYAFERGDGADGFPSLSTTGAQATRSLVAKLVRADPSDAADARAALAVLAGAARKDGVFQAAAALYGVAATKLAVVNQPWVLVEADDELQLELPTNCVWDDNEQLCELARAKRLAPGSTRRMKAA